MNGEMLRERLDAVARECPVPDVADRALRTARRRRMRRYVGSPVIAAVAVAAAVFGGMSLAGPPAPTPVQPAAGPGSIPDRIFPMDAAALPSVTDKPIGRAAVFYTQAETGASILVGADGATYRRLPLPRASTAGAVLSPDGTRLAYVDDFGVGEPGLPTSKQAVKVLDLRTGHTRSYKTPFNYFAELQWSPDGQYIASDDNDPRVTQDSTGGISPGGSKMGSILNLANGHIVELPQFESPMAWLTGNQLLVTTQDVNRYQVVDVSGQRVKSLTSTSPDFDGSQYQLAPSPDGGVLAYVTNPNANSQIAPWEQSPATHDLNLAKVDENAITRLTKPLKTAAAQWANAIGWLDDTDVILVESMSGMSETNQYGVVRVVSVGTSDGSTALILVTDADAPVGAISFAQDVLMGGQIRHAAPPS